MKLHKKKYKKMDEVERLAEIERRRRQKEMEQKLIEEQTAKRIEETVNRRVQEELDKRKDEIENEVLRRIEEAKKAMEAEMMKEIETRRLELLEEEQKREVGIHSIIICCLSQYLFLCSF